MVKINVESFSEEELRKRWNELVRKESWDEECEKCKMLVMLHKGPCTRSAEVSEAELPDLWKAWSMYKDKMKPIRKWQADEEEKKKMQSDILIGMNKIAELQNTNMVTK